MKMMGENVWHQKQSHISPLKCHRSILDTLYVQNDCCYLKSPLMILFICSSPLMVERDPTMKNPSISGIVKTMTTEMRLAGFAVPSNMYLYPTMAIAP